MKHSIFKKIIAVFFATILLATIVAGVLSFVYNSDRVIQRGSQRARAGALSAAQVIENVDFDKLRESDSSQLYIKTRSVLKTICQSFELKYLYIYEVNPDEDTISFIMTVATDDEADVIVAKERGLGVVVPRELTEQEQLALQGKEHSQPYREDNVFGGVYSWFYPVYDNNGNVVALIGSDCDVDVLFGQVVRGTLLIILSMVVVLILVFLIPLFSIYRKIFAPIKLISNRMRGFVTDEGTNFEPLHISSEDEIQEIADSFEKMSDDISKYLKDIEQLTTERVQKNVELEVAGRIQSGIVPKETTMADDFCTVYACAKPAKVVGGDFYDCFKMQDGKVCIVIGDVSGKGVAAAMFMVMAKTMLRDYFRTGMSPAEVLNTVNDALCRSNPEGMFATVFAAVLDLGSGMLCYANAGHTRPVIFGSSAAFLEMDPGIALGLFEDADIKDDSVLLEDDGGILIYTDGATEAVNKQNEFFSEERLLAAVKDTKEAELVVKTLGSTLSDYVGNTEQFDDYTVLALSYRGNWEKTVVLKPEISSLSRIRELIQRAVGKEASRRKIYLACEEVFANIISHSKASESEVEMERRRNRMTVTFSDNGIPFDPVSMETDEKEFEEFDSGGMGISLVKKLADTVDYDRIDNRNVLTLGFHLGAGREEENI